MCSPVSLLSVLLLCLLFPLCRPFCSRTRLSVPRRLLESSSMTGLQHDWPEGACPFVTLPNDLNNRLDLSHTAQNTFRHSPRSPHTHHRTCALAALNGIAHYWRSPFWTLVHLSSEIGSVLDSLRYGTARHSTQCLSLSLLCCSLVPHHR